MHFLFESFTHLLKMVGLWILDGLHPIGWKLLVLYGIFTGLLIFLMKGKAEKKEKSWSENLLPKLLILLIAEVVIFSLAKNVGPMRYIWKFVVSFYPQPINITADTSFPIWWVWQYAGFGVVAFLVFVFMDMPSLGEKLSKGAGALGMLLALYISMSALYAGATYMLPQFDPQFEIDEINKPPVKVTDAASPEAIRAGKEVFETYKCFNCHKIWEEGSSDRGPNLGAKQLGLYSEAFIKEQIVDPYKLQAAGFDDEKSKTAMPDYYGDDISEEEMVALVAFLKSLKDPTKMPVEGKSGEQWSWWDDPKIIAEGKELFEGVNTSVNCSVCHGKDGGPLMTGAFDFRDGSRPDIATTSTDAEFIGKMTKKPLKEWDDSVWIKRTLDGVPGSAMAEWKVMEEESKLLKAAIYARTFHDPLSGRSGKKDVGEIKAPEEFKKVFQE